MWSLGGDLLQPIFNGGRNRANLALSRAAYDESVANYRESVLVAFQQVEDGLSGLALLNQAAKTQQAAVADSRRALDIANNRYVGGVTTYLDVITAQSTLLNNERLATQLLGQQMVTSVLSGEGSGRRVGRFRNSARTGEAGAGPGGTAVTPPGATALGFNVADVRDRLRLWLAGARSQIRTQARPPVVSRPAQSH